MPPKMRPLSKRDWNSTPEVSLRSYWMMFRSVSRSMKSLIRVSNQLIRTSAACIRGKNGVRSWA